MPTKPDSRDQLLSDLHEEHERLRAERRLLQHDFSGMPAERRALIDDLRASAGASRRRASQRGKGD